MPPPVRRTDDDYHFHAYDYAGAVAFTPGPAQPNRNNMQFYSMERDLNGLLQEGQNRQVPNIALTTAGYSHFGRRIRVLSFGDNNANAPTVTFTGGIHAREWIAHEMVYLIAEYLIINYTNQPQNRYAAILKAIVDERNIQIIPMLNPDGNEHTVFGVSNTDGWEARYWRKNRMPLSITGPQWVQKLDPNGAGNPPPFQNVQQAGGDATYGVTDYDPAHQIPPNAPAGIVRIRPRTMSNGCTGVDLNRNFATQAWGYECAPFSQDHANWKPSSDTYFGPQRNSETETQGIQAALVNHPPRIMIDYHSYSAYILYPSEAFNLGAVNADYAAVGRSLRTLTRSQSGEYYQLGTPLDLLHYDGTGSIIDHAAQQHATRALTIELDPANNNQGDAGFILSERKIRRVFERNIRGALVTLAVPDNARYQQLVSGFQTWNVYGRGNRLPSVQR